eukprot:COSAG06_NODE_35025_length_465_cov_1.625683_1_plen_72_part_00
MQNILSRQAGGFVSGDKDTGKEKGAGGGNFVTDCTREHTLALPPHGAAYVEHIIQLLTSVVGINCSSEPHR